MLIGTKILPSNEWLPYLFKFATLHFDPQMMRRPYRTEQGIRPSRILKLLLLTLPLLAYSSLLKGQEAAYKASLDSVPKDAFYRIPLKPKLTLPLSPEMEAIRIRSNGEEIPFIVRKREKPDEEPDFRELLPLESQKEKGRRSLVLKRPDDDSIGPLVCYTEKPDRTLELMIHGSEKRKDWEALRNEKLRSSVKDTASSEFHFDAPFPSGHKFYRFRFKRGSGGAPIIAAIGHYEEKKDPNLAFQPLPLSRTRQKEKAEKSYVELRLDTPRVVERIEVHLEGPPFFRRTCTVGLPKGMSGTLPSPYDAIGGCVLEDSIERMDDLEPRKSDRFLLVIEKGPNPALELEKARVYQRERALLAHLEKGKAYELYLGGALSPPPSYELAHFRDSIPDRPPLLPAGDPEPIAEGERARSFYWIWGSIIVAILVLALFSYRMVRERSRKNQDPPSSPSSSDS